MAVFRPIVKVGAVLPFIWKWQASKHTGKEGEDTERLTSACAHHYFKRGGVGIYVFCQSTEQSSC